MFQGTWGRLGSLGPSDAHRRPLAPVLISTPPFLFLQPWFRCVIRSHLLTSPLPLLSAAQRQQPSEWVVFFPELENADVWNHIRLDRIAMITALLKNTLNYMHKGWNGTRRNGRSLVAGENKDMLPFVTSLNVRGFWITALLGCNSCSIKSIFIKCAIQWFSGHSQSCASITTI